MILTAIWAAVYALQRKQRNLAFAMTWLEKNSNLLHTVQYYIWIQIKLNGLAYLIVDAYFNVQFHNFTKVN